MMIVQEEVAASVVELVQVPPVCVKYVGLAPPIIMPAMLSVALPVLLSVRVCVVLVSMVWLPNATGVVIVATGAVGVAATPVPVRVPVWGEPAALSVMLTVAEYIPVDGGVKV